MARAMRGQIALIHKSLPIRLLHFYTGNSPVRAPVFIFAMAFPLQERYVNFLTDSGFKRVFGTEANQQLLIDFLNTLLPEQHRIHSVTYKQAENLGPTSVDRKAIFDIYCQAENGDRFIVEMQKVKQNFFKDRWLFLLKHLPDLDEPPDPLQDEIFDQLFEVAEIANISPVEQDSYQDSLKYYRDLNNVVDTFWQEGKAEGIQEGLERGLAQGRQEGVQQMKTAGLASEAIAEYTGSSLAAVAAI